MSACRCSNCRERKDWKRPFEGGFTTELADKVQSEIEWQFLWAFVGNAECEEEDGCIWNGPYFLQPQARVGPFRTDFIMGGRLNALSASLAIELDGHEFHQKTPEQVEKDRQRDRAFVRLGVVVLRFSGREVTANPTGCVHEGQQLLQKWLTRKFRR